MCYNSVFSNSFNAYYNYAFSESIVEIWRSLFVYVNRIPKTYKGEFVILRIIFLGYVVHPDDAKYMTGISFAGNNMQYSVVSNLHIYDDIEITPITISPVAAFPKDTFFYRGRKKAFLSKGLWANQISFLNLPIIKQIWQTLAMYHSVNLILKDTDDAILFTFNLFPQIGLPVMWLKKKYKCQTISLIADFPIDDNTNRKWWTVGIRKVFDWLTWKCIKCCDRYIVLNKSAGGLFLQNKSYLVIEGGIDRRCVTIMKNVVKKEEIEPSHKNKNILFCGALTTYNGIENLLKSMEYIKHLDIELHIYGDGYLKNEVISAAADNTRIKYFGTIAHEKIYTLQANAWLLINPRLLDDPISKVTFPSKTFEYLLSGTPVLTTRLNCYPDEYMDKMLFADGDTPIALSKAIKQVYSMCEDEIEEISDRAKKFVESEKTWEKQCEKIYQFLKG